MNVRQSERDDNRIGHVALAAKARGENCALVDEQFEALGKMQRRNGGIMGKVYVSTLMVILFSTVVVSFSYAQASCCAAGSGCCGTPNIAGVQQQPGEASGNLSQAKVVTTKMPAPQINPMPWSASVKQIGDLQRLLPAATTGLPGKTCCPGANSTGGCCGSPAQSALIQVQSDLTGQESTPSASAMNEVLAFSSIFGTLW